MSEKMSIGAGDVGTFSLKGAGTVLPPGSVPGKADLPADGPLRVTIDGFDASGYARLVYPCGFVKHHQAETVESLAAQVVNQMRGRYAALFGKAVEFTSVPAAVKAGESFVIKGG